MRSSKASRRLRAQLRHTDRAAHLGALVASLSHELNQPLTGILANAQAGLMLLPEAAARGHGELREILEAIVRDDRRAAAVVANLRSLLRREADSRIGPAHPPLVQACLGLVTQCGEPNDDGCPHGANAR